LRNQPGCAAIILRIPREMAPMSKPEFWPAFCQLAETYEEQGRTREDRIREVVGLFSQMPPMAQRQVVDSTLKLSAEMHDVYAAILKAAHASEQTGQWGVVWPQ